MLIKSVSELVKEAMEQIKTISVKELKIIMETNKKAVIIDIRDIRELKKTGKVKLAKHVPRGMLEFWLDPSSPYFKKELAIDKPKILYCASNWRSALAVKTLQDMGFKNICHVEGGFKAIEDGGFQIEKIN